MDSHVLGRMNMSNHEIKNCSFPSYFTCAVVPWVTQTGNGNDCFLPDQALKPGYEVRCNGRATFLCFHQVLCNVQFTASSLLFHVWFSVSWSDGYQLPYMSALFLQVIIWKTKSEKKKTCTPWYGLIQFFKFWNINHCVLKNLKVHTYILQRNALKPFKLFSVCRTHLTAQVHEINDRKTVTLHGCTWKS